jgi:predicted flavoprotein YhiN
MLGKKLNDWVLTPSGTEGMRTAEVCVGGVSTAELSSKTMESIGQKGLYFIGETVDVTGWLGGYNFHQKITMLQQRFLVNKQYE